MRLFFPLSAKNRKCRPIPQEPVPFREILPLKLKPTVSGKGSNMSEVCCLYEMSVMFACFQANEFQQKMCSKEIDSFQRCYMNHLKATKQRIDRDMRGILTPGDKNLPPKQLNMLLKKFPNM